MWSLLEHGQQSHGGYHQIFEYMSCKDKSPAPLPDKKSPGQNPPGQKPPGQKPPDKKPPNNEIIIQSYYICFILMVGGFCPRPLQVIIIIIQLCDSIISYYYVLSKNTIRCLLNPIYLFFILPKHYHVFVTLLLFLHPGRSHTRKIPTPSGDLIERKCNHCTVVRMYRLYKAYDQILYIVCVTFVLGNQTDSLKKFNLL